MKHFYRYLPISDEARRQSLYVLAGGYTMIPPNTPYPPLPHPAGHDFRWRAGRTLQEYQLIYITRGGGQFESHRGGHQNVRAGTLVTLFPSEWHRYHPNPETGWDEYWIAFQGELAPRFVDECELSVERPLSEIDVDAGLIEEYLRIMEEMRAEAPGYQQIIAARGLLIMALTKAALLHRDTAGTAMSRIIAQAKCAMLERSDEAVNMEDLAAGLHVGYSWFRRTFRQQTGLPPAQYHLQLRIHRACELLRGTTLPIAVISDDLGFESAEYFSRVFKSKEGCTPRAYRAMAQTQITSDAVPG